MEEIPQQNLESRSCPHCPWMKVTFNDIDSLKAHIERCKKERRFRCELCGCGFRTKKNLKAHGRTHNRGPKSVSCSLCKRKFHSRKDLSSHERVHQKPKFICADCGRAFQWKQGLAGHCMRHLGLKPFKCKECQKGFSDGSNRNRHQLTHRVAKPFTCADCGKSYMAKGGLMKHVLEHLGIGYGCSLKQKDGRRFCCDDCGKSYTHKRNLMEHVRKHLGVKYHCGLCGKQFSSPDSLRKHKQLLHGPNGSLRRLSDGSSPLCPHCPLRRSKFADSESLKAHIATCRLERPFACDDCQLRFSQKENAARHQRTVHKKSRFI